MNGLALCAGVGGLELGLTLVLPEYRAVCYVEREAYAAAALVARMEDAALDPAPVWDDLRTFDGRPWRGVVDIVTAGYPCQPFSAAGKQAGEADPRHLWPDVRRVVGEVSPPIVFVENVATHLAVGFERVRADLRGMGYRVAAGLFSAEETGAPHRRTRLFALAYRAGDGRGEGRPEPAGKQRRQDVAERGGALAHAGGTRREGRLQRPLEGWTGPGPRGYLLANATNGAGRLHARSRTNGSGASEPGGPGEAVADTDGKRRCELDEGQPECVRERRGPADPLDLLPLVPPGPDAHDEWARVLAEVPEVEPSICGVAPSVADRLDRLRVAGNGVHPVAAALAFVALWRELSE